MAKLESIGGQEHRGSIQHAFESHVELQSALEENERSYLRVFQKTRLLMAHIPLITDSLITSRVRILHP